MLADYIIIRGPIGVGKTTIAKEVVRKMRQEEYKCSYFSIDDCCLNLVGPPHSYDKKSFVLQMLYPCMNELIKERYVPIIDGFLTREHCQEINASLKKTQLCINIFAPLKQCIYRDSQREGYKQRGVKRVTDVFNIMSTDFVEGEHIIKNENSIDYAIQRVWDLVMKNF